jgi:uncharacterized protein (DUF302 family)
MLKRVVIFIWLIYLTACAGLPPDSEIVQYYSAETSKPYDEVVNELKSAVSDHNFRIAAHSRLGKAIRERGAEGFPDYDIIQICNLTHAKNLLEISPHLVRYMPCKIVLYQAQGKTIVKTHLLPTDSDNPQLNSFFKQMNQILKEIIDFAATP